MGDAPIKTRFPWLKLTLALSLMLNLLALGVIGAIVTRAGEPGSILRAAVSALPDTERRALRRETRQIWRDARIDRTGRSGTQAMLAALRSDEFDPDAFADSLTQAQERLIRISDDMHSRLIRTVSTMSPEDRRAYADALEAQLAQRRWRAGSR